VSAVSDHQWLRQIGVDDPHANPDDGHDANLAADDQGRAHDAVIDLDAGSPNEPSRARRYTPWVAGAFVAAVVAATVATMLGVTLWSPDDPSPPRRHPVKSAASATAAAPTPPVPAATDDHPLPFTAAADCPPGSTTAQSIADPEKPSPWICVRHTEGQPLYITLGPAGIERAYVITAVSIVPGDTAPAQGSGGGDPWLQHRVVTRLQWQFNDTAHTVVDQDTGNGHGEAVKQVPGISASKITVVIQQTSRPAVATPTTTPGEDGGPLSGIVSGPTTSPDPSGSEPDPSDGTFAVSSIKIIGHKAL
jgi:hypothetical protein